MSDLMREVREGAGFGLIYWAWRWWDGVIDRHGLPNVVATAGAIAIFFAIVLTAFTPVNLLWIMWMALRVPYDFAKWALNRRTNRDGLGGEG